MGGLNPSPERLRELFAYDAETGVLTHRHRTGKYVAPFNEHLAGRPAGTLRVDGYIAVRVDNVIHAAHRVIWAMVHGEWPECVRHRNRIDADNRLANLYASTQAEIRAEQRAARERASQEIAA